MPLDRSAIYQIIRTFLGINRGEYIIPFSFDVRSLPDFQSHTSEYPQVAKYMEKEKRYQGNGSYSHHLLDSEIPPNDLFQRWYS